MKTYTTDNGAAFEAPSHRAAHAELSRRLRVDGPRVLVATTEDGAEVRSSLYPADDYIQDAAGRVRRDW